MRRFVAAVALLVGTALVVDAIQGLVD